MRTLTMFPEGFMDRKFVGVPVKVWFPIAFCLLIVGGLFSPLFSLSGIHGLPTLKLYCQHLYWDVTAGLGGYYAATYCKHAIHRWAIMIAIDLICTFFLVTVVG
jgi:hypothetical protein